MKFMHYCDITAPIDYVFDCISDFEGIEHIAHQQDMQVEPFTSSPIKVGDRWSVKATLRQKERQLNITLTSLSDPHIIAFKTNVGGFVAYTTLELIQLSPKKTRCMVKAEIFAKSLSARFLLQSFKLAKSRLTGRFEKRVTSEMKTIENRYLAGQPPSIV